MFRSISDWQDKEGSSITEDEFFLKESDFPELYRKANELYKRTQEAQARGENPNKLFDKPIEQLSPKGLALISYIYSQKDNSETQPVIASTVDGFKNMVKMVAKAPPGTHVTVIFQPTDGEDNLSEYYSREFPAGHKTVCKLERDASSIRVIHMDGTQNSVYGDVCKMLVEDALKATWREKDSTFLTLDFYSQKNPENPNDSKNDFARQNDTYQCGIFAMKDARQLNRDHGFSTNMVLEDGQYYSFPASYLKNMQSKEFSAYVLSELGAEIVAKEGRTLQQTHEKHNISGYVQHFSQKYHDYVTTFLETHKDQPEKIRECVEKYDADKMTLERLTAVYASKKDASPTYSTTALMLSRGIASTSETEPHNPDPASERSDDALNSDDEKDETQRHTFKATDDEDNGSVFSDDDRPASNPYLGNNYSDDDNDNRPGKKR